MGIPLSNSKEKEINVVLHMQDPCKKNTFDLLNKSVSLKLADYQKSTH